MAIRANTLVDSFDYVSQYDEAIDHDVEEFDHKWKLYRDGMGEPPLKAGAKPTLFKLRHVTSTERVYLMELSHGEERGLYITAAAMALVGVKGLEGADGKKVEIRQESTSVGPVKIRHATKDSLDALPLEVILELGALALERSSVRPNS